LGNYLGSFGYYRGAFMALTERLCIVILATSNKYPLRSNLVPFRLHLGQWVRAASINPVNKQITHEC
jgi:hypothetical protein